MAKVASKKSERSRGSSDLEELEIPAPAQMVGPAINPVMPAAPQQQSHPDMAKHEIRDSLAMGGMSDLERQHMLQTNVFMTDEDRAAYSKSAPPAPAASSPMMMASSPPTNVFAAQQGGPVPHAAPIGGHQALGFDGSLAPQGVHKPQGLMTSVGMIGFVKGLLGIRSDGPAQLGPKGGGASAGKAFQPSQMQSQQQAARPQASSGKAQGSTSAKSAPAAASMQSRSAGQGSAYTSAQGHFQPTQSHLQSDQGNNWFGNALWKRKGSPFGEVITKFFSAIKSLFGFGDKGSMPRHMRGRH